MWRLQFSHSWRQKRGPYLYLQNLKKYVLSKRFKDKRANSVELDEVAYYLTLHCMHIQLFSFLAICIQFWPF